MKIKIDIVTNGQLNSIKEKCKDDNILDKIVDYNYNQLKSIDVDRELNEEESMIAISYNAIIDALSDINNKHDNIPFVDSSVEVSKDKFIYIRNNIRDGFGLEDIEFYEILSIIIMYYHFSLENGLLK